MSPTSDPAEAGTPPSSVPSPWNVAVGVWLGETRRRQKLGAPEMARHFGGQISVPYLRSIEAGQNGLPATAIRGLVEGYGLTFSNASTLVASVRLLDAWGQREKKGRLPDLVAMRENAQTLRKLWPAAEGLMDWLVAEITRLEACHPQIDTASIRHVRESARDNFSGFDALVRGETAPAGQVRTPKAVEQQLNPFVRDAVSQFLERLALMPPQMTRELLYRWEADNQNRMVNVWGVVSDPSSVLASADSAHWEFLINAFKPTLQIFLPASMEECAEIEAQFTERLAKSFIRPGSSKRTMLRITIQPWGPLASSVSALLRFDQTTRSIPDEQVVILRNSAQAQEGGYVHLRNCWIYELNGGAATSTRFVGLLDSAKKGDPEFFCVSLSSADIERWQKVLGELDAPL